MTPLDRCRGVYAAQRRPLRAAAVGMEQWQVHIAAMNKLVLGVITLPQANQFWNQTRVGARDHLHAFTAALERFGQGAVRCPQLGSEASGRGLKSCQRAVAARNGVLNAAKLALGTWALHVRHMEMLRSGMMSPARATQLWLQAWHAGQQEVDRYRSAAQEARTTAPTC